MSTLFCKLSRKKEFFRNSFFFIYYKYFRYLEDLYTLTYHEDSSIDQDENESKEIDTFTNVKLSTGLTSLQVRSNNITYN